MEGFSKKIISRLETRQVPALRGPRSLSEVSCLRLWGGSWPWNWTELICALAILSIIALVRRFSCWNKQKFTLPLNPDQLLIRFLPVFIKKIKLLKLKLIEDSLILKKSQKETLRGGFSTKKIISNFVQMLNAQKYVFWCYTISSVWWKQTNIRNSQVSKPAFKHWALLRGNL